MIKRFITLSLCILTSTLVGNSQDLERKYLKKLQQLEPSIEQMQAVWKSPGMAVAVIYKDRIIYKNGFGYRQLSEKLPVTPETVFPVGSITKSMAAGVAIALQDDGLINIDQPIYDYIPEFRMADKYRTQNLTLRDLMLHRSGLPRHDAALFESGYTNAEFFERLDTYEFVKPFRTDFLYSNFGYMITGHILEKQSGKSFDQLIEEKLFSPLNMQGSVNSIDALTTLGNYATGYKVDGMDGETERATYRKVSNASGSANVSVNDLANWLMCLMNGGTFNGTEVLSEMGVSEMTRPQISLNWSGFEEGNYSNFYGLGLNNSVHRGLEIIGHGGDIDGFTSQMEYLPGESIGVVVITNKEQDGLTKVLPKIIFDKLLDLPRVDYHTQSLNRYKEFYESRESTSATSNHEKATDRNPSHNLTDYVGTFKNRGYNKLLVEKEGNSLVFKYGNFVQKMNHMHYDMFTVSRQGMKVPISFKYGLDGSISKVGVMMEPMLGKEIIFEREN